MLKFDMRNVSLKRVFSVYINDNITTREKE